MQLGDLEAGIPALDLVFGDLAGRNRARFGGGVVPAQLACGLSTSVPAAVSLSVVGAPAAPTMEVRKNAEPVIGTASGSDQMRAGALLPEIDISAEGIGLLGSRTAIRPKTIVQEQDVPADRRWTACVPREHRIVGGPGDQQDRDHAKRA